MAGIQHDDNAFAAISEAEHTRVAAPQTAPAPHPVVDEKHSDHAPEPTRVEEPRTSGSAHPVDEKHDVDSSSASDADQELDADHEGLEFPTEEEKKTLRRVADTIPWNAYC